MRHPHGWNAGSRLSGPVAGMLHTGRSRNDQVATDLRMWRGVPAPICCRDCRIAGGSGDASAEHRTAPMPGYTHLQRAQVVSSRTICSPTSRCSRVTPCASARHAPPATSFPGNGALAGSTLPLDRDRWPASSASGGSPPTAWTLRDRDFAVEITAACARPWCTARASAKKLVLWSSAEFGFRAFPTAHATGSSLMPQKKNADVAELAREECRVIGDSSPAHHAQGAAPQYNRDLQETRSRSSTRSTRRPRPHAHRAHHRRAVRHRRERRRIRPRAPGDRRAEHLVANGVPSGSARIVVRWWRGRSPPGERSRMSASVSGAASDRFDPTCSSSSTLCGAPPPNVPGSRAPLVTRNSLVPAH